MIKNRINSEVKYFYEIQKCKYYCPRCKHTNMFELNENRKLCDYCGYFFDRPKKSVRQIAFELNLKRRYENFKRKKVKI